MQAEFALTIEFWLLLFLNVIFSPPYPQFDQPNQATQTLPRSSCLTFTLNPCIHVLVSIGSCLDRTVNCRSLNNLLRPWPSFTTSTEYCRVLQSSTDYYRLLHPGLLLRLLLLSITFAPNSRATFSVQGACGQSPFFPRMSTLLHPQLSLVCTYPLAVDWFLS